MPILLDTQIVLWLESNDPRISEKLLKIILEEDLLLSQVSIWEIAIKIKIGKLNLNLTLNDFVNSFVNDYNCEILDITLQHIYQTQLMPLHHRDPFDRLLIAQAVVEQIAIVSSDEVFDQYGVNRIF